MSVLIKGMEMPTSCFDCPFMYGRRYCRANSKIEFNDPDYSELKGCYDGCPLVPVPPHGGLGDLDEFAKVVLNWITTQEKAYPNEDSNALSWRLGAKAMGHQIYRDIEAAPIIIPASEEVET